MGDEVCALLISGGYADKGGTPADLVLPGPAGVSVLEAAAPPEAVRRRLPEPALPDQ